MQKAHSRKIQKNNRENALGAYSANPDFGHTALNTRALLKYGIKGLLGRLDDVLYPFYKNDIANSRYTKEEMAKLYKYFLNKFWAMSLPTNISEEHPQRST